MSENNKSNFYSKNWRLSHLYFLINKDRQKVPLIKNKSQILVCEKKKELREKYGCVRLMILKGRQQGVTTYAGIDGLDDAMVMKNMSCMITAHKQSKQKEIFKKIDYAYENFPKKINLVNGKVFKKPKTRLKNVNELFFKNNNSGIQVSLDARSGTYNNLHITELAFRWDAEEMMTGTMPSIPQNGDVVIETTANGIGNYFHKLWTECYGIEGAPFHCLFLGWWLADEYRMKLGLLEKLEIPEELSFLSKPMIDGTLLDDEQIKWYINTEKLQGKMMKQEYPCTPEEAFLSSGDPVFSLNTVRGFAKLPFTIDEKFKDLRIYRPAKFNWCTFGVDTAEGGADGDFSSIRIRDENLNLLAEYYGRSEPDHLCLIIDHLISLGYIGVLGIERNNTGLATIVKAKEYIWFSLIYQEKIVDTKTQKTTQKVGWHTNSKTRPIVLSDYSSLVREGLLTDVDERLRHEMYSFIFNDRNRPEASKGNHDDAIMSDAICCYMRNYAFVVDKSEDHEED